jgi:2-amino-4-hydroxy-6-hydroxymethyldihydropteridine diphosphokinase
VNERVFVGLGSNLFDRARNLRLAIAAIRRLPLTRVVAVAPLLETDALLPYVGAPPQPAYLNTAVELETSLPPMALMHHLLSVEVRLGRVRRGRWSPRTIDLDLLRYGNRIVSEPGLVLPHPRQQQRRFVLLPLTFLVTH